MSANPQPAGPSTPGAVRSAAEIRRDIDVQRQQLGTSVEALRVRVTELTDWRRQVHRHRRKVVAGAIVAGFAIGVFLTARRG